MTEQAKNKKCVLLVIASKGFSACEYQETKKALQDAGVDVFTVSDTALDACGDDGSTIVVDADLGIIDVSKYDGIFLIGGPGTLSCLNTPRMHTVLRDARDMGLAYGAIDLAVRVLAHAKCLVGKDATGLDSDRALNDILETCGARYRATDVIICDGVVTCSTPGDTQKFAQAILKLLREKEIDAPKDVNNKRA